MSPSSPSSPQSRCSFSFSLWQTDNQQKGECFCHTETMATLTASQTSASKAPAQKWTLDARVKFLLLIAFSIAVFVCPRWSGMALFACLALGIFLLLKHQRKKFLLMLVPVVGLSLMVVLIRLVDSNAHTTLSVILDSGLIGTRFVLLAAGSLYVALTTKTSQLIHALRWLLTPLQHCGINTHSIVTVLTMAVSFIPRVAEDFQIVYAAQRSRGATFTTGNVLQRLKSWSHILIPVFISLFRHADTIALAMDARCYGASGVKPTSLHEPQWTWRDTMVLVGGLTLCAFAIVL